MRGTSGARQASRSLALATVMAATAGSASAQAGVRPNPAIELTRVTSIPLEAGFSPTGLAAGAAGRIALWSAPDARVAVWDGTSQRDLPRLVFDFPIAAAFEGGDSILAVLDAERREILRFDWRDPSLVSAEAVDVPVTISSAVKARSWYVGGWNATHDFVLFRLSPSGDATVITTLARDPAGPPPDVQLAAAQEGVLVTRVGSPHETVLHRFSHDRPLRFETPAAVLDSTGTASFPVLPLGDGFLQLIADLRSDARELLLFGPAGELRSRRTFTAPIAFFSSRPAEKLLFGADNLNRFSLIVYRWRRADDLPHKP